MKIGVGVGVGVVVVGGVVGIFGCGVVVVIGGGVMVFCVNMGVVGSMVVVKSSVRVWG